MGAYLRGRRADRQPLTNQLVRAGTPFDLIGPPGSPGGIRHSATVRAADWLLLIGDFRTLRFFFAFCESVSVMGMLRQLLGWLTLDVASPD